MKFNKQIILGSLVPSLFILSGCSNEAESINELVGEMNTQSTVVIDELNNVTQLEGEIQTAFSDTLKNDEKLTTLVDKSSPVFETIQNREDGIEEIEANIDTMGEITSKLKEIELSEIDTSVILSYIDATDTVVSTVYEYIEQYRSVLVEERSYFESLTGEEASYQTFSEGVEEINSLHLSLQESYAAIDDQLENFYIEESNLTNTVDELLNEE
ncbi:YkyA family protein [Lacticigenium naphthae]|uniref:YkyA family protein n=1 Tax=Lacticigenium naphthae TaxID=515351 RepID=UPI00040972C6|nr:YkyA family protein [Lacticigenium naphthae]